MSSFSRREILGGCLAGTLGAMVLGRPAAAAVPGLPHLPAGDLCALAGRQTKTRLYLVFLAKKKGQIGWPYHEYDHAARAAEFRERLSQVPDIEWVGGEIIEEEEQLRPLKERIEQCDGLVVCMITSPTTGKRTLLEMMPTVPVLVFNDLFCGDCGYLGFHKQATEAGMRLVSLSAEDLGLLERKLQLLRAAARLRRSRMLVFSDNDRGAGNLYQGLEDHLGLRVTQYGSPEINEAFQKAGLEESKKVAERWVASADQVVEPSREEIVNSARMYLALKAIMDREQANAVTVDCLTMLYAHKVGYYPCLAFVDLNDNGYVGACEADVAATVTMLIVGLLTDRPGFISDPVLDTEAGLIYHAHCVAPTRMAGLGARPERWNIRSHSEDRRGASAEVKFTPGNKIIAAKYVPYDRMLVSTGEIVGNKVTELACRSKMTTTAGSREGIQQMIDNYSGGLHRVIFYGDCREDLRDLGKLLRFEVVEETKV